MEIDPPIFKLRRRRCECCSGQGALCFYSCPKCGHTLLICDEIGTVFPDPNNLEKATYGGTDDPSCNCPNCGTIHVGKFIPASGETIQKIGVHFGDYE